MRFFMGLTLSIFLGVSVGHTATLELPGSGFYPIRDWGSFPGGNATQTDH